MAFFLPRKNRYDMCFAFVTIDVFKSNIIKQGQFNFSYGEGEPTDNATDFYEWLMGGKGIGDDDIDMCEEDIDLQSLSYFLFGLGNKTYEHFNSVARRVDKAFRKYGARRIGVYGEGDDDAKY
jgi:sulfite reductase alpha subunit-like flavoprotein